MLSAFPTNKSSRPYTFAIAWTKVLHPDDIPGFLIMSEHVPQLSQPHNFSFCRYQKNLTVTNQRLMVLSVKEISGDLPLRFSSMGI
jgi:hypothetical protein